LPLEAAPVQRHPLALHDALPISRIRMGNKRGEILIHAEAFAGVQRGVVIVESIAPNADFEGEEGINTLTSAIQAAPYGGAAFHEDRKSTRLNSSHVKISYAVFCL